MNNEKNKVLILQGISGSGKSTYAQEVKTRIPDAVIVSADDFFFDSEEGYKFDPKYLGDAHAQCMRDFLIYAQSDCPLVIVDNTNTTAIEMAPYYLGGRALFRKVEVVRVVCQPAIAAERNKHGVPFSTVVAQQKRMETPPVFWECSFRCHRLFKI